MVFLENLTTWKYLKADLFLSQLPGLTKKTELALRQTCGVMPLGYLDTFSTDVISNMCLWSKYNQTIKKKGLAMFISSVEQIDTST